MGALCSCENSNSIALSRPNQQPSDHKNCACSVDDHSRKIEKPAEQLSPGNANLIMDLNEELAVLKQLNA